MENKQVNQIETIELINLNQLSSKTESLLQIKSSAKCEKNKKNNFIQFNKYALCSPSCNLHADKIYNSFHIKKRMCHHRRRKFCLKRLHQGHQRNLISFQMKNQLIGKKMFPTNVCKMIIMKNSIMATMWDK